MLPRLHDLRLPGPDTIVPFQQGRLPQTPDLSEISKVELDAEEEISPFKLSVQLQEDLCGCEGSPFELTNRVCDEVDDFVTERKERVREALKEQMRRVEHRLSVSDKTKLRSRREARVSKFKQRAYESALKDSIRWTISSLTAVPLEDAHN